MNIQTSIRSRRSTTSRHYKIKTFNSILSKMYSTSGPYDIRTFIILRRKMFTPGTYKIGMWNT